MWQFRMMCMRLYSSAVCEADSLDPAFGAHKNINGFGFTAVKNNDTSMKWI